MSHAVTVNRIDAIFRDLRRANRRALMPFVCAGYPGPGGLGDTLRAIEGAGASIVEIGIPFSDPIADGPVIAAAMHQALLAGCTPERVFEEVRGVRDTLSIGLVAMVSVSLVYRTGDAFLRRAAEAGFDGVILPDVPLEEAPPYLQAAKDAGLTATLLVAPTTPPDRAARIAQACTGFVYMLARTGITGERDDAPEIADRVTALRQVTQLPIACGFGISTPEHVRAVVRDADAAIVGSAMVRRMGEASRNAPAAAAELVANLCTGLSIP